MIFYDNLFNIQHSNYKLYPLSCIITNFVCLTHFWQWVVCWSVLGAICCYVHVSIIMYVIELVNHIFSILLPGMCNAKQSITPNSELDINAVHCCCMSLIQQVSQIWVIKSSYFTKSLQSKWWIKPLKTLCQPVKII